MYYCEPSSTWATVDDLYSRFGDEYVDKLAIRRIFDVDLDSYVADESSEGKLRVITLALCDSKELIKRKISCLYSNYLILDDYIFPGIKQWHIKMTIETLKIGGDCMACECNTSLDEYLKCGSICTEDGVCLSKNTTFIEVSESKFCCERLGRCKCC